MVALDSLIRLHGPADPALIRHAEALGAHVQALILASRAGAEGATWAREAADRIGERYDRSDQLALLDMVASQRTPAAAAVIWRDCTAKLIVVVRDPPQQDGHGPMGMFGSRSGGGRKRVAGEPWPEAATYRLRRQGGEALPGIRYQFGWERTLEVRSSTAMAGDSLPKRLELLAAMAQAQLDRPVDVATTQRKVTIDWRNGEDVASAVRHAQGRYRGDWTRFLAELSAAGFAPAAPVVQFPPPELVDARRSGQAPLEPVNGTAWILSPPPPPDPEEIKQREAFDRDMQRLNADPHVEAMRKAMGRDGAPAGP